MARSNFERLHIYRLAEELADRIWEIVRRWEWFAKETLGKQVVRAADSIGANIAEGLGRGTHADNRRFVRIARGSLNETKHWIKRARQRNLLADEAAMELNRLADELAPRLNAYLRSIGVPKQRATEGSEQQ